MSPRSSLQTLGQRLRVTPWEVHAALASFIALVMGLSFLFYPNVYALSKGYAGLQHLSADPKPLGLLATFAAVAVFVALDRPLGRWALLLVAFWHGLMLFSSLLSVGLSGGAVLYTFFFVVALYGVLKSGGVRAPRSV